jgi:hypothetical protein
MKNVKELFNQSNLVAASGLAGLGIYAGGMMGYGLNSTIALSQSLTYTSAWLVNQVMGSFASIAAQTITGMLLAGAMATVATAFAAWFAVNAFNYAMTKFAPAVSAAPVVGDEAQQNSQPAVDSNASSYGV